MPYTKNRKTDENVRDWPTLTVRVPQEVYDAVLEIATRTNRSLSYVGLELIERALENTGENDA